MPWKRIAKIAAGVLGLVVVLVGAAAAGGYYFLTSADFRSRVESEASAYSGRKTKIAKISIDWGVTAHVHLAGVEVANADWGKADHMFKADEVDFDIRLWPLLKGDLVLPTLVVQKPEIAVEAGDKEQLNWSFSESPVTAEVGKAVTPKQRVQMPLIGRLQITEGKLQYQDP